MKAVILAGGAGLRLRKVIKDNPKPMASIAGRPFLEYLILQLTKNNIKEIIISTGYKGSIIKDYFGNGAKWGAKIKYSEEDKPLGTGGGVRESIKDISDKQILVMNGDSFLDIDFDEFISFHNKNHANTTIALACVSDISRYGKVEINENNEVVGFSEKQLGSTGLINGGVYILNRNVFDDFPEGKISLENRILPGLVNKNLFGMKVTGFFVDIGIPQDYLRLSRDPSSLLNAIN